jgi:hypothetical protein
MRTTRRRASPDPRACFAVALCLTLLVGLAPLAAEAAEGELDGNEDFKLIATDGFGLVVNNTGSLVPTGIFEPFRNSYAWSMVFFQGKLYVGTGRFELDAVQNTNQGVAEIWRYTPAGAGGASGSWQRVFQSPLVGLPLLFTLPRDLGYRWMTVCDVGGVERLYISTFGPGGAQAGGGGGGSAGNILVHSDSNGTAFAPVSTDGFPDNVFGFRSLVCFNDTTKVPAQKLLLAAPVGWVDIATTTYDTDRTLAPARMAIANADPAGGAAWTPYTLEPMGGAAEPDNNSFFTIYHWASQGKLVAGVTNDVSGAQLWTTPGCLSSPCTSEELAAMWTKIIDKGAGRPLRGPNLASNAIISDLQEFNGALYIAYSVTAGERVLAELVRLHPPDLTNFPDFPNGRWELLIGEPRLNVTTTNPMPAGFWCGVPLETLDAEGTLDDCPPTTRRGAGVGPVSPVGGPYTDGNQFYIWRLLAFQDPTSPIQPAPNRLFLGTLQGFGGAGISGFDILATLDGVDWKTITNNGLGLTSPTGTVEHGGMRSIAASPFGLFIGSTESPPTDPPAPGGCAVWLGTCSAALAQPPVADAKVNLKSSPPGRVVFNSTLARFIAYDDENAPGLGNGLVTVTLNGGGSHDPFCGGPIQSFQWAPGNQTGSCGAALSNPLAGGAEVAIQLCTDAANPACAALNPGPGPQGGSYAEYAFTLRVVDGEGNPTCKAIVVRASANLPPVVAIQTDPPAVFRQGRWELNVVDWNASANEPVAISGMCLDPEGTTPSCAWSHFPQVVPGRPDLSVAGQTLPFADADPATLGTLYTLTIPTGIAIFGGQDYGITLTGTDVHGNTGKVDILLHVNTTTDDTTENDEPVCQGTTRTIPANSQLVINPIDPANRLCLDPDGTDAQISYQIRSQPPGGGAVGGGNVTYTPPPNVGGSFLFSWRGCDAFNACSDDVGVAVTVRPLPVAIRDFNANGRADVLWQAISGPDAGLVYLWLMDGANIVSAEAVTGVPLAEWAVRNVGDFDGDGKADVLWQAISGPNAGLVYLWLMNGSAIASAEAVTGVPGDWTIQGVGDFDGDGRADVLWRHTSGLVYTWLMDGGGIASHGSPAGVENAWTIQGVGDFDGDGRADVLWRHASNATTVWLMNGISIASTGPPGSVFADWVFQGIGDFNGDGKADVLWRDGTGALIFWLMNGGTVVGTGTIGSPGAGWEIQNIATYNADAKADILWRNTTTGAVAIWFMDGTSLAGSAGVTTVGAEWEIK